MPEIDIIIPVFNESYQSVYDTVYRLIQVKNSYGNDKIRIIIVDDGSHPALPSGTLESLESVILIKHRKNKGYGAALKTGIRAGSAPWIAIIDADGTYPAEEFKNIFNHLEYADMVIGCRTGDIKEIPRLRRLPKAFLNGFASYLANTKIDDLNSGMRVFKRTLAEYLWELFPNGFSFTSTITMGAILGNYETVNVSINYYKRIGSSSIHPIKDTLRFFKIVMRLGLMFSPARIFSPVAAILFLMGFGKGFLIDYSTLGYIGNLSVTLMLSGVQIIMMGLIAELIVHNRKISEK